MESIPETPGTNSKETKAQKTTERNVAIRNSIKDWLQIIALLVAAGWAGYTFYYDKIYEPKSLPPFIVSHSQIVKISEDKSFEMFRVTISVQNKSQVDETFPASWFMIFANQITRGDDDAVISQNDESGSKNFSIGHGELIYWNNVCVENTILQPEQEFTLDRILVTPKKKKYEAFTIIGQFITANTDHLITSWNNQDNQVINVKLVDTSNKNVPLTLSEILGKKIPASFKKYRIRYYRVYNEIPLKLTGK
jgi:hypothetical protein